MFSSQLLSLKSHKENCNGAEYLIMWSNQFWLHFNFSVANVSWIFDIKRSNKNKNFYVYKENAKANETKPKGAMTLSIITFSINGLFVAFCIKDVKISINGTQHDSALPIITKSHYAECRISHIIIWMSVC